MFQTAATCLLKSGVEIIVGSLKRLSVFSLHKHVHSPFLHYRLVSSLQKINIGNTGNQNHPDLKVRVVLVTCISNNEYL